MNPMRPDITAYGNLVIGSVKMLAAASPSPEEPRRGHGRSSPLDPLAGPPAIYSRGIRALFRTERMAKIPRPVARITAADHR